MGEFLRKYNIRRETVVIMTKIFFSVDDSIPEGTNLLTPTPEPAFGRINRRGLSRKHIMAGVANSLRDCVLTSMSCKYTDSTRTLQLRRP